MLNRQKVGNRKQREGNCQPNNSVITCNTYKILKSKWKS